MSTLLSILARSAAITCCLIGTTTAQDETLAPLLEGRVVWQQIVPPGQLFADPNGWVALPDGQSGMFLVGPAVQRVESTGRTLWSQTPVVSTARNDGRITAVGADGGLWLAIVDRPTDQPDQAYPVTVLKLAADDGRILHRLSWSLPASDWHQSFRSMRMLPLGSGSAVLLGVTSDWPRGWRLARRDAGGTGWDVLMATPSPEVWHAGWSLNRDGSASLIANQDGASWLAHVSPDGRGSSWQSLPANLGGPLPVDGSVAYTAVGPAGRTRPQVSLRLLDPVTRATTTLRALVPEVHDQTGGPVSLRRVTSDGIFVLQAAWLVRAAPTPRSYIEGALVSRDGRRAWRIPLRMWDRIIDSRSVVQVESVSRPERCQDPECHTVKVSLVSYSP